MLANEILFEKPGKYDWVPDKEHSTNMPLAGRDLEFEYKGKTYKFKPVIDAAKKFGSLYRAGRGGKKDSPIRPVIKALQAYLATSGLNPGPIDGFYGEKTAKAVIQLQRKLGVTVDGDVGPNTAKAMVEEFKNFTVGDPKDNAESKATMADNWFSKHTKFSTFDDFFEDFKTRYLAIINGFGHLKNDFPKPASDEEAQIRKAVQDDIEDAKAYIGLGQKKSDLVYKDIVTWKDMVQIYSNFPLNKKQIGNLYNDRQMLQQKQLDKWTDDQIGSKIGGTATKMTKGSAVDQYEPKKLKAPPSLVAPNAIKLSQPDIPDHSKYWKQ